MNLICGETQPEVIELAGPPGSGKTHMALRAHRLGCRVSQVKASRGRGGIHERLILSARAPLVTVLGHIMILASRGAGLPEHARVIHLQRSAFRASRERGRVVIDEGPVHAIFISTFGTRSTRLSRCVIGLLLKRFARTGRYFLFLDPPRDVLMSNVLSRVSVASRFGADSDDQVLRSLASDEMYPFVSEVLAAAAGDRCIRFTSTESAELWLRDLMNAPRQLGRNT